MMMNAMMSKREENEKRMSGEHGKTVGPKPETVKIEGDWEGAVGKALKKPRPKEGWPKPDDNSHSRADSEPEKDE